MGGFGLGVELKVGGVDDEIIKAAHEVRIVQIRGLLEVCSKAPQFCPYSRALKHGVDVKITKV